MNNQPAVEWKKEWTDLSDKKKNVEQQEKKETKKNVETEAVAETVEKQSPETDRIAELEAELQKVREELAKEKEQGMRVRAEYDNYRKRTAKEIGEISADVTAKTVQEILPIADNIERALAADGADADLRKGIQMVQQQIENAFHKLQIEAVGEENTPFDPNLHNAVMHVEDKNIGENMVVQVFQKGYKIGSKVLRYAMVKVAN